MQPEATSFLVQNFFTFYRMTATWRIQNKKYDQPIQKFIENTQNCLTKVQSRSHDNLFEKECPYNNLHYHNIFVLIKYVRILDNRADLNHAKNFADLMNEEIMRNNSTMAIFLLMANETDAISGQKVCEYEPPKNAKNNLCTEFTLFTNIL